MRDAESVQKENTTPTSSTTSTHDPTTIHREPEAKGEWGTHYAAIDYLMAEMFASEAVGTAGGAARGTAKKEQSRLRLPIDAAIRAQLQEFRKHLEAFSATAKPVRPLAKPGDEGARGARGAQGAQGARGADLPPQTTTGIGAWQTSRATGEPQATSPTGLAQIAQPSTGTPQPGTSATPPITQAGPAAHLQRIREIVEAALRSSGAPEVARDQAGQPPTGLPAGTSGTGTAAAETAEAVGAGGKAGGTVTISRAALEEIKRRLDALDRILR